MKSQHWLFSSLTGDSVFPPVPLLLLEAEPARVVLVDDLIFYTISSTSFSLKGRSLKQCHCWMSRYAGTYEVKLSLGWHPHPPQMLGLGRESLSKQWPHVSQALVKEKCDPCSRNTLLMKQASYLVNQAYCPSIFWFFSCHFLCFYETLAKVVEGESSKVHVDLRVSSKGFLSFQTFLIRILLLIKLRDEMLFFFGIFSKIRL